MSALTTMTELRKMQMEDLVKETRAQENIVVRLRMGVRMSKEKDSAKYKREKRQLAKMNTILSEKKNEVTTPPKES